MILTIVVADNIVVVDGYIINTIDLSGLDPNLRAVQWDGTLGHEEYYNQSNIELTDISKYQDIIDAHYDEKDLIENPPPLPPEEIFNNTLTTKLKELLNEKNTRVDTAVGTSDPRKKDKLISRSVKLLRREFKSTITTEEEAELNNLEALDDYLDALDNEHDIAKAWLEDISRTLLDIENYNVSTDPAWPVL